MKILLNSRDWEENSVNSVVEGEAGEDQVALEVAQMTQNMIDSTLRRYFRIGETFRLDTATLRVGAAFLRMSKDLDKLEEDLARGKVETQGRLAQRLHEVHVGLHDLGCHCSMDFEDVKPELGVFTSRKLLQDTWEDGILDLSDSRMCDAMAAKAKTRASKAKKCKKSENLKCKSSKKV